MLTEVGHNMMIIFYDKECYLDDCKSVKRRGCVITVLHQLMWFRLIHVYQMSSVPNISM